MWNKARHCQGGLIRLSFGFRTSDFGLPDRACCIDPGMDYELRPGVWVDKEDPRVKAETEAERQRGEAARAKAKAMGEHPDGFPV
jgi:hypothetical protein